jgi:hypothetical protein
MTNHELYHFYTDEVKMCWCNSPEAGAVLLRDILNAMPCYEKDNREKLNKLLPSDGLFQWIMSDTATWRLTEHGGGLGGSWITDRGKEVRDALNALDEEGLDKLFDFNAWTEDEETSKCKVCCPTSGATS